MATNNRDEEREQARFIRWTHLPQARAIAPCLKYLFHCPNGGKRDGLTGAQMKALGVKPGVPDLLLPFALTTGYVGLAIEMKRSDGTGRLTDEQKDWLAHLDKQGWATAVATSAEQARADVAAYLGMPSLLDIAIP